MMHRKTVLLLLSLSALTATAQHIRGTWHGELAAGMVKLPFVLHVDNDSTCRADSPDQGRSGVEGRVVYVSADSLLVRFSEQMVLFGARLTDGVLRGTFVQGLMAQPLTLQPGPLVRPRPQTPQPPFPYATEEVTFRNEEAGATLAGTLTLPEGAQTVLLMVTGSGQQNRDEELMGHRPFAVIADYLARHGIATLRYDDRATAQSVGGEVRQATTADFAADAEAGLAWLRRDGRFPWVGILGHSEGGTIAFMLGGRGLADCIVSLAGPAVRGDSLLLEQNRALLGDAAKDLTLEQVRRNPQVQQVAWYRYFLDYDPQPDITRLTCPVLALNGGRDRQVTATQNLGALRRCLPRHPQTVVKEYPDLNHLFQHSQTGMPDEYGAIAETVSPEVLSDLVGWLRQFSSHPAISGGK